MSLFLNRMVHSSNSLLFFADSQLMVTAAVTVFICYRFHRNDVHGQTRLPKRGHEGT